MTSQDSASGAGRDLSAREKVLLITGKLSDAQIVTIASECALRSNDLCTLRALLKGVAVGAFTLEDARDGLTSADTEPGPARGEASEQPLSGNGGGAGAATLRGAVTRARGASTLAAVNVTAGAAPLLRMPSASQSSAGGSQAEVEALAASYERGGRVDPPLHVQLGKEAEALAFVDVRLPTSLDVATVKAHVATLNGILAPAYQVPTEGNKMALLAGLRAGQRNLKHFVMGEEVPPAASLEDDG